jgi:hypothetical protein
MFGAGKAGWCWEGSVLPAGLFVVLTNCFVLEGVYCLSGAFGC